MMNTTALIEQLNAARQALSKGETEQALSLMRDVYEAQHFTDELGGALARVETGGAQALSEFSTLLDALHQRTSIQGDLTSDSLGMSLSDFFADVPQSGEPSPLASSMDEDFEMLEIVPGEQKPNLDDHFGFADLGGELSFDNLDLSFPEEGEVMSDSMIVEDIWPEDSLVMDETSEPIDLVEVANSEEIEELEIEAFEEIAPLDDSDPEDEGVDDLPAVSQGIQQKTAVESVAFMDQSPAFESSDAQAIDGFFDEIDDQAQWFASDHQKTAAQDLSEVSPQDDEHESSVAELVEISHQELSLSLEPGGISGVSETQDGLDVFGIFTQTAPQQRGAPSDPLPPRRSTLPTPASLPVIEESPNSMPAHYEAERSPRLDFDMSFDDSEPVEPEPTPLPRILSMVNDAPSSDSPVTPAITTEQDDSDLFDDLFDFDLPAEDDIRATAPAPSTPPAPPAFSRKHTSSHPEPPDRSHPSTHVQQDSPSLGFGDLDFEEDIRMPSPTRESAFEDPPTRQMNFDIETVQRLTQEASFKDTTQGGFPSADESGARATRSLPIVDRELVNPFDLEEDDEVYFGEPVEDEWSFDNENIGMPGLDDDWLDAPEQTSQLPGLGARDVHNDATAIPGLNSSNSGIAFDPYKNPGVLSTPSTPPQSMAHQRSSSSSLKQTQEGESGQGKAMRETVENEETIASTSRPPVPSTLEHNYLEVSASSDEPSDPFDFDLGLSAPKIQEVSLPAPPKPPALPTPPAPTRKNSEPGAVRSIMFGIPFAPAPDPEPLQHTKLSTSLAQGVVEKDISEDEFFALAESIAAEQSVVTFESSSVPDIKPYRGEPMMRGEPSRGRLSTLPLPPVHHISPPQNPFHQQTPTGVREALLSEESSQVSFSLEEVQDDELDVGFVPLHLEKDQEKIQLERARTAYKRGHFEDALDMIAPLRSGIYAHEAKSLYSDIELELENLQLKRIGSLELTPQLAIQFSDLSSLQIDHRAGFLLSQVDGMLTFEDIIDLSSMSRLETMLVLADLLDQKIIKVS